jgi:uncharacterized protein (TIGR03437 family)
VKLVFRLSLSVAALILACGGLFSANAQTDPFVAQLTSSPRQSFANDMTGNGRFVVVESNGDIGTKEPALNLNPDNSDGNREIFLIDYAQRRIFQITNTKSRLNDTTMPPTTITNIRVEISNNQPAISNDGRYIIFNSNANSLTPAGTNTSTPGNFDANTLSNADRDALLADANTEIWVYEVPPVTPVVDLSSGAEAPFENLSTGSFLRITNSPASRLPIGGMIVNNITIAPVVGVDNRDVTINDNDPINGVVIAFISTRNLPLGAAPGTNADLNPEVYWARVTTVAPVGAFTLRQVTVTPPGTIVSPIFSASPSLSGTGARVAYASNANIPDTGMMTGNNADGNAEVYYADLNVAAGTVVGSRQVTRTTRTNPGDIVNVFNPGRRISRDGNLIAFESAADLGNTTPGANLSTTTVFIFNASTVPPANPFTKVGPRGAEDTTLGGDVLRFPTFTDYTGLTPGSIVFASRLNFKPDGTIPTTPSDGLNPDVTRPIQIYAASLPISMAQPAFVRLTKIPPVTFFISSIQPLTSNTRQRISFTLSNPELGGGNTDGQPEVFYLLTVQAVFSDFNVADSYATGASNRPVGPVPSPTPTPSPAPTPVTPQFVGGLSPGMLAVVRFPGRFVVPSQRVLPPNASTRRSPSLPIELGGVSLSVSNAAAGLYSVSQRQIVFVVPPALPVALAGTVHPVVINIRGNLLRGSVTLIPAQPDIFTTTNGPGGRAEVVNAFNGTREPFTVFTVRPQRPRTPTVLSIILTGVESVPAAQITVRIGTTTLSGAAIRSAAVRTEMPGFYRIDVQLPATLAGAGDVPVVVTITAGGTTFTSRLDDTAPRIFIL